MRFIYKNITETTQIVNLLSDDKTQVTSIPLGSGARVEVSNGNLDIYVPHILARLDDNGNDISYSVIQAAARQPKSEPENIPVVQPPVEKAADNSPIISPVAPVVTSAAPKSSKKDK